MAADGPLAGRCALVTGASRGIGAAIAVACAEAGADVALVATTQPTATSERVRALGRADLPLVSDVSIADQVGAAVEATIEHFGRLDILVNNAGVLHVGDVVDTAEVDFQRVLDVNLKGPFLTSRAAAPHMIRRRSGVIVNIGSDLAVRGRASHAAYCSSKGGLLQLTRTLAMELGPHGVRVVMLSPALTVSDMSAPAFADPVVREQLLAKGALGQANEPEDVARSVVFLASDAARTVTGCNWPVDGGATAS